MIKVGPLTPSYITVDPVTGRVSANFSGTVSAEGVILPAFTSGLPGDANRISWKRADGATLGVVTAGDDVPASEALLMATSPDHANANSGIDVLANKPTGTGAINVNAFANQQSVVLVDDIDRSSFPQVIPNPQKLFFYGPLDTGVTPGVGTNVETQIIVALPIDISTKGVPVFKGAVGALYDGAFSAGFGWRFDYPNNVQFRITFHCLRESAVADSAGWRGFAVVGY